MIPKGSSYFEIGRFTRPHGYRGELFLACRSPKDGALAHAKTIYLNRNGDYLPYRVEKPSWMPKGWKLKLDGIDSDEQAKKLIGRVLYLKKCDLPSLPEDEYYVSDLIGAKVVEAQTEEPLGVITGVEPKSNPSGQDLWWAKINGRLIAIPATKHFISKVDFRARTVILDNFSELT